MNIGITTSFIAELWALHDGLILFHNLNLHVVEIHTSAQATVEAVKNASYSNHIVMPIVDDCKQLISQLAQVQIGHYYSEANACADFLARKGVLQANIFILY